MAARRYERLGLYEKSALYLAFLGEDWPSFSRRCRCGNGNAMARLADAMQGNKLRRSWPQTRFNSDFAILGRHRRLS